MAVDFDIKSYFSAKNKTGFPTYPASPTWYRPWELAYLNFSSPGAYDTIPPAYQYPPGGRYEDGLRLDVDTIQITDTLDQGSWMTINLTQCHDRDFFEVADNQAALVPPYTSGQMLPRFEFPCRPWTIDLSARPAIQSISGTMTFSSGSATVQGVSGTAFTTELRAGQLIRADAHPNTWHTISSITNDTTLVLTAVYSDSTVTGGTASKDNPPATFTGMLSQVDILPESDEEVTGVKDGVFKIALEFDSFDNYFLRYDINAPLWYHRLNDTTNGYHWAFTTQDDITFDGILDLIINGWMNVSRPTIDFPATYRYTTKGIAPYTTSIKNRVPKALTGTLTWTNASSTVSGSGTKFSSELSVGLAVGFGTNPSTWYIVASIESDTSLTLTTNYSTGGAPDVGTSSFNINWVAVVECKDRPTWDIVRDVLIYMGALEGNLKKYIPSLSFDPDTGYADVNILEGGFDKTHVVDEDFRQEVTMNSATSTTVAFAFNQIKVPFTAVNDNEYWIQFILYKSNGAGGWNTVKTIPSTEYEYVKFDALNTHSYKMFKFPLQDAGTYKWEMSLITAGSFAVAATGGKAYSAPMYTFPQSPTTHKYKDIKTFAVTQGRCSMLGLYKTDNPAGCKDGGITAASDHANTTNECPDQQGCYPDILAEYLITGTITTHLGTAVEGSGTAFVSQLMPGFQIKRDAEGSFVTVKSIESNTALTLMSNYGYAGSGTGTLREGINPTYGLRGIPTIYADLSNQVSIDTKCRQNSQRLYDCYQNRHSSVRIPAELQLDFETGWTDKLVGLYIEVYNIILNQSVIFRCTEQVHTLKGDNVSTSIKIHRV